MITISNQVLTATINIKGAELSSLKQNSDQQEYIWQADPIHWGRHAPILFPFVGKLRNDEFKWQDRTYVMSQHGFARDMDFEIVDHQSASASFRLKSSAQTLMMYPFKFELLVHYELKYNKISVGYEVVNKNPDEMRFSIGGHPAFNCPMTSGEKRSDYRLVFNQKEQFTTQLIEDGLRTGSIEDLGAGTAIEITDSLFDQDALILSDLSSEKVTLQKGDQPVLSFDFKGFPYLGIWSKSSASPFICLEPWYGIADRTDTDQNLSSKEGMQQLAIKGKFNCSFSVEIL
ncbi:MAG: galactose mutarotase-like enzyme [Cyclobacteriaceae bacterium]|jgi:galactose mutarotase-like enzyme